MSAVSAPFIAADVGGTHARVGLVRGDGEGRVDVLAYHKYRCADYSGLVDILQDFIKTAVESKVDRVSIACAGYPVDGMIVNANLPWSVSVETISRGLGIENLEFINDFEAVAHATRFFDPAGAELLRGPAHGEGPVVVVGPGTGLGSAVHITNGKTPMVLPTEGGQINLAPTTPREIEVLRLLSTESAYVPYEKVLSGPGLVTLYQALASLRDTGAELDSPEAITIAALDGGDAIATETLEMFCALLGSFVGNLAILYGASGGVYLTGGILPEIQNFLRRSDFSARFLDKGSMRAFLERVPVRIMEHGRLGVIGAAGWSLGYQNLL